MKSTIRYLVPPVLVDSAKRFKEIIRPRNHDLIEWEFVPEGWQLAETDAKIKGWNVNSVLEAYKTNWPAFVERLKKTSPLVSATETNHGTQNNLALHNILMTYAYALTLSSRNKSSITMLDWGGGIGHYFLIGQSLVPDLEIDYHCKDVPLLVEYGRELFPRAHFYSDESCLTRQYDLVFCSTSLHYSQDWKAALTGLARATGGYMLVSQLPTVMEANSFVMVQRPYQYGYNTEYLGWCLNRQEFLRSAEEAGLKLVRQFLSGHQPFIHGAPEQCEYRGFLFRS
jgi:putative methyltransferase (TIGR04325 family)